MMDRERYLKGTTGIVRIHTIELLDEIDRLRKLVKNSFEEGWRYEDKDFTTIENGWYESETGKVLKEE